MLNTQIEQLAKELKFRRLGREEKVQNVIALITYKVMDIFEIKGQDRVEFMTLAGETEALFDLNRKIG